MNDIQDILNLHNTFGTFMLTMILCSLRIAIALSIIPVMSPEVVKGVHRMAISMAMASFVAYGQSISGFKLTPFLLVSIMLKEALLGLIFGFCASTVFWVAANVGFFIDDLSGFNNVQVSNPMRSDTSTPTSSLLSQLAITAFWVLGGMMFLLGALYQSFQWWPILSIQPDGLPILESFVMSYTDSLMEMSIKLAAPMMLILIMVDFSFGFLAKGAEKIDTMSLSMPVKGAMTLLLLAIFITIFISQVSSQLSLQGIAEKIHSLRPENTEGAKSTNKNL